MYFFPDSTEEASSERGGVRGLGARVPVWRVPGCFTQKEYAQRHCLLPGKSVRLPRLYSPLCYRTTNTTTPVSHLETCIRLKSATKAKARRRDRMANQRSNLSCKALALQPIRWYRTVKIVCSVRRTAAQHPRRPVGPGCFLTFLGDRGRSAAIHSRFRSPEMRIVPPGVPDRPIRGESAEAVA